ncbi:MAG TPA: alpha/beta fold hydrolase [Rhizomicrobium sp.]|nr:alpha/beta fold hydrolase [Rhizomicrobium sp.]
MSAARPPVLLMCGQLCTERLWRDQIPALAALTDVAVSVQRQHETVADMARAVLAAQPGRFSIVAHAMGAFVAFEILRQAGDRVASLALLSTLAPNDTPAQTARREGYLRLVEAGKFDGVVEERIPILLHPARRQDAALVSAVRQMARDTGAETFLRQQRAIMSRPDSRPGLRAIACPTLIVFGRQDGIVTLDHQTEMCGAIAGARLEIIEDCGHLMTLEQPERVTRMLADWIAKT